MTSRTHADAVASLAATETGLRLFVRCHGYVFALEAGAVERLLLADEVEAPRPVIDAPRACVGVLTVGGRAWVAWDLGLMLEQPPVRAAYLLLRPPDEPTLALALRTDRCLHVGPPVDAAM